MELVMATATAAPTNAEHVMRRGVFHAPFNAMAQPPASAPIAAKS